MNAGKINLLLVLITGCLVTITGCSVGTSVYIHANEAQYPVSHTNSFYSQNNQLQSPDRYHIEEEFSFSFKRWGVSTFFDIERESDISEKLNALIEENGGDAIVDLTVSINNPSINHFSLGLNMISGLGSLVMVPVAIFNPLRRRPLLLQVW